VTGHDSASALSLRSCRSVPVSSRLIPHLQGQVFQEPCLHLPPVETRGRSGGRAAPLFAVGAIHGAAEHGLSWCLDWMLIFGRRHLARGLRAYLLHYNRVRPNRGLGSRPRTRGRVLLGGQPRVSVSGRTMSWAD
jgi:hypothetical protein